MWRRSNEVEEQARVRGRDKREGKKEREKRRRETSRRPMARDLRNGSFFSSLFIPALPFPSSPTSSPIILLPLLLRSSSSSSTRWLHACTYACSVFFVRRLFSFLSAVRLFLPVASSLVLLAFPHVHLLLHRRRTFVHVPVHSFVKSLLASSGHVAHAATKRGRNGRPMMVAQVKMANDSFTFPFYPLYQFFHLLFFVIPFPNAYHLLFSRRKIPWNYDERKVTANEVAVRPFYHSPIPVEAQTCGQCALPLARKRIGLVDRAADLFGPCRPFCIGILKSRGMKREEKLQGEAYYYASE